MTTHSNPQMPNVVMSSSIHVPLYNATVDTNPLFGIIHSFTFQNLSPDLLSQAVFLFYA